MDVKVTATDIHNMGYCVQGMRDYWTREVEEATGLTFREFLKEGVDVEKLLALTENALAQRIASEILLRSK